MVRGKTAMDLLVYSIVLSVIFAVAGNGLVKTAESFLDARAEEAGHVEISQRYR